MGQKTLLAIAQQLAPELNLPTPTGVLASTDQSTLKVLAFVRAVCEDLLNEADWEFLQTQYQFTTTTGVGQYALPTDVTRTTSLTFYDMTNRWVLRGPRSAADWGWLQTRQLVLSPFNQFRIFGGYINILPVPTSTTPTFQFEYISSKFVRDGSNSTLKTDFTQDSDVCLFDHRLVIYGVKLKWYSALGQDTGDVLSDYRRALEFAKGYDTPASKISLIGAATFPMISTANVPDGSWA